MTPKEKGWLKTYLESRKELFRDITTESGRKASHPEHSLYRIVQPMGLMYGESSVPGPVAFAQWSPHDRMKLILAESLISSSLLFHDKPVSSNEELSELILETVNKIGTFYNHIFPELSTPAKTFFGRKLTPLELAEKILDKRIGDAEGNYSGFWASFFHNSLLFLDVYIFGQWIHTGTDKVVADFFRYERDELRFSVVKVMSAAAHANKVIAPEEKKLFEFFLQTTQLPSERKKVAMDIFDTGIAVEDIDLPSENSWILKKFFLEIAILTLWADRKVDQIEIDFLKNFSKTFGFSDEELETSLIAIEGYVLENWAELEYLKETQDFQRVSEHYIEKVGRIAEKNKASLTREVMKDERLPDLLEKANVRELSTAEKEEIRVQLMEVMKTIPTFSITSLPQKFLTLPILLKILPATVFSEQQQKSQ